MSAPPEDGAYFSLCGQYRYLLIREWDDRPILGYCGLNPSLADATREDATSHKFRGFAERLGYGGYVTGNLYAFIATDPRKLREMGYPVGPDNDDHLARAFRGLDVICAWGSNARGLSRPGVVLELLRRVEAKPLALKINKDRTPAHPLYLPYTLEPSRYAP